MMHFADIDVYKAISSQVDWMFRASQPPGDHERGACFTTLRPEAHRFSARTRIPKEKQAYVFAFRGDDGLRPLRGGKGKYIFWTPNDYVVAEGRQEYHGATENLP